MCGRMSFGQPSPFNQTFKTRLKPRYNIGPGQRITALNQNSELTEGNWGMHSSQGHFWINARWESWTKKPAFQQCTLVWIPTHGWYEWKTEAQRKIPYYFHTSQAWFWVAGLMLKEQIVVLTQQAQKEISHIHDRMPLMHPPTIQPPQNLEDISTTLLDSLNYYTVSTQVNKSSFEGPTCIEPVDYPTQTSLF